LSGVEREARPERDPHAEDLQWIVLEREHVRRALDHDVLPARRDPCRETELRLDLDGPRAVPGERELHVASGVRRRLAEESPQQLAVVVDDEPETHRITPGRSERRHGDAPRFAQDLPERAVQLAPVRDGQQLVDSLRQAALGATARGRGERAIRAGERPEARVLSRRPHGQRQEVLALARGLGAVLEVLAKLLS
jgi:hypothetical protein